MRKLNILLSLIFILAFDEMSYAGWPNPVSRPPSDFIENKGQVKDQKGRVQSDVRYIFSGKNFNLILKDAGFSYQLFQYESQPSISEANGTTPFLTDEDGFVAPEMKVTIERFDASFVNPSKKMNIIAGERSSCYHNYYLGNTSKGVTQVHSYKEVCYQNIYPNIDLVFTVSGEKDKQLEYRYIVHPGGNIADIKIQYKTPRGVELENGSVMISGRLGFVKETGLFTYQNDQKFALPSRFLLKGNVLSFDVKNYDRSATTVIDPSLVWGTYYGGEGDEEINQEVALDNQNNVLLVGTTNSTTGIASVGAYQTTYGGNPTDICLAKFNSSGTLLWSTFFGGDDQDIANSVAVDNASNIIVAGNSKSSNITTPGAYQENNAGAGDVLLSKFDSSGQIIWSTLYGGSFPDQARSVCVDNNDDIYMGSYGSSPDGVSTPGVYQEIYGGAGDAYITKFSPSGSLLWGSYFSGPGQDRSHTVNVDELGAVYISGTCESTTGIATSGAHQTTLGGGTDAFLAKFDTANGHLFWATYYGGEGDERGRNVVADGAGNVYIDGYTLSKVNMATAGSWQPEITIANGGYDVQYSDAFVAKFTSEGNRIWGTYYGGSKSEECFALAIDTQANIYFGGSTTSEDSIASPDAYQTAIASTTDQDAYFVKMDSAGHKIYGSYLGGLLSDETYDLDVDENDNLYLTARTYGSDMPVTPGAYQSTNNGNSDYTLYKFSFGIANGTSDNWNSQESQDYIKLYPNPTDDQLNIYLSDKAEGDRQIMIYDLPGKMVLSQRLDDDSKLSLDVSTLEEGMYLMRIQMKDTSLQQIFLVRR
ncbi:MAG TPA: T9SS type A sorting domain-containing protein [Chitinophagales bacterium]|nr:T9SS type A sorting domain-containing protein [Chitinophagales bacterium]